MTLGDIAHLVDPPDGCKINLQAIILRIHGLVIYVRSLPQRREAFEAVVEFVNSQSCSQGVTPQNQACRLILDVRTCGNSTYNMLQKALQLQEACKTFCGSSGKPSQYSLSDVEWDKVAQIIKGGHQGMIFQKDPHGFLQLRPIYLAKQHSPMILAPESISTCWKLMTRHIVCLPVEEEGKEGWLVNLLTKETLEG
ncbi:uncharacterized protein VP01_406g6 [Puccinia sorghi]|uniref:Uncharacterized protein n=1 Tax=Puccinia sorghi TaxID=27349 RepID=A0A0L6UTF7_9BASI|nr:uncharacterized protein VP01_406g6 [Puccinia sorghi]